MSKRAEEAALKAYPDSHPDFIEINIPRFVKMDRRHAYIEGYEQAEKDIWGRIEKYLSEQDPRNYATAGFILKNFEYFKQQIMKDEQ